MTPFVELLLVLGAIYISECFVWVRTGGAVFRKGFGRARELGPLEVLTGKRGGLCWVGLAPFDLVFRAIASPLVERSEPTRAGAVLRRLRASRVRHRLRWLGPRLRGVRVLTTVLFLFVFAAVPGLYFGELLFPNWIPVVSVYAVIQAFLVGRYFGLHLRIYRHKRLERWQRTVLMMIAPTYAMRAVSLITLDLFGVSHRLAIRGALLPTEAYLQGMGAAIRELRYPLVANHDSIDELDKLAVEGGLTHESALGALAKTLALEGYDVESAVKPPERQSGACAYCPRCEAQFDDLGAQCDDCRGMRVVSFEPGSRAAHSRKA